MLTRADVHRGLATRRPDTAVAEFMHRSFPTAGPSERLEAVLDRLAPDGGPVVVVRDDTLVGLLDPEHVGAVVAMRGGTSTAIRS